MKLILNGKGILTLKVSALRDQLALYKKFKAPNLLVGKQPTWKADMQEALLKAIDLYVHHIWIIPDGNEDEFYITDDED